MTFQNVLQDIANNLVGNPLNSISGRSNIVLTGIDFATRTYTLRATNGKVVTRTFSELETVWAALMANPAVHVDSALKGSRSSRSHPETILANLPYIEWFRLNKRKHITYVAKGARPYGQLQKLDANRAAAITRALV